MNTSNLKIKSRKTSFYQIIIEGNIREDWSDWLAGMKIVNHDENAESQTTTLTGTVIDQAALRGIICRLWDLNQTIISVQRIALDSERKEEKNEQRYFIL
ncbi:MAG: hypothetical protein ACYDH1_00560 [Anaerolineaceae bacterium]